MKIQSQKYFAIFEEKVFVENIGMITVKIESLLKERFGTRMRKRKIIFCLTDQSF